MGIDPGQTDGITARAALDVLAGLVAEKAPEPTPRGALQAPDPERDDDVWDDEQVVVEGADVDEIDLHDEIEDGVRARRAPYLAAAATAAAGYGAWGVAELADAVGPDGAGNAIAAGTIFVTAAALPVLRAMWRHRIPDAWRRRWWLAGIAGAAWVDVAAANGPVSLPMTAALVLGSVALGARWAAEHEVPNPSQVVVPELVAAPPRRRLAAPPVVVENRLALRIEQAWPLLVAAGEAAVAPGSELHERTVLTRGVRWEVHLDPGRGVGATALVGRADALALPLQVSITDIILEVGPREDRAFITITEGDALTTTPSYPGPEYVIKDNGDHVVPIGLEADGEQMAEVLAYEAGQGVRNLMATGDMGSGKTALLELGALGLHSSGIWRVWWGDGDPQGSSSNLMMDTGAAHWAEKGADGLLRQLAAFEALLESRARVKNLLTAHPITGLPVPRTHPSQPAIREIPPCEAFPGYMWFMPEFFAICQDEKLKEAGFVPRFETAIRRTRKFGLGGSLDTQSALGADFAGSSTLRAFMGMSNAFMMRTTNASEQFVVNGLTVSPGLLPKGGGYGLAANRGRVAPFRTFWVPTLHEHVPALPPCKEDPDAVLAISPYIPVATLDADTSLAEQQAEMEKWRAAALAGDLPDKTKIVAAPVSVAGVTVPQALTGKILPMTRRPPAETAVAEPEQAPRLSPKAARVLAALESRPGPWRSAELVAVTGLTGPDVSKALKELVAAGVAHRPAGVQGVHAAGAAPTAAAG